jgi:hypothetical protein
MYRALSQFVNYCVIEYLEPYFPNEQEKNNPTLYSQNVQQLMAKHMGIPITKHGFQCSLFLSQAENKYKQFDMNFTIIEMIDQFGLNFKKEKNDFEELLENLLKN